MTKASRYQGAAVNNLNLLDQCCMLADHVLPHFLSSVIRIGHLNGRMTATVGRFGALKRRTNCTACRLWITITVEIVDGFSNLMLSLMFETMIMM